MPAKISEADFAAFLQKQYADVALLVFEGLGKTARFLCKVHRIEFETLPRHFKYNNTTTFCPECRKDSGRRLWSFDSYKRELTSKFPTVRALDFTNHHSYAKHTCKTHGEFLGRPNHVVNHGCPSCNYADNGRKAQLSQKEYDEKLASVCPTIRRVGPYCGMSSRIEHQCKVCTTMWFPRPGNLIHVGSGCPTCAANVKTAKIGNREVCVQGFEPYAISWILHNTTIKPSELFAFSEGCVPIIPYEYGERFHKHKPDLYVPGRRIICEVKGPGTIGLTQFKYASPKDLFERTQAKAKAARSLGFRYNLLVFDGSGRRIKVPKNWTEITHSAFKDFCTRP